MTGMENFKSWFGAAFRRKGSSPFIHTVALVILYIQEWRGMEKDWGCILEKVSWWAVQTANVCNCVIHTLPTGMEKSGKNLGKKLEKVS